MSSLRQATRQKRPSWHRRGSTRRGIYFGNSTQGRVGEQRGKAETNKWDWYRCMMFRRHPNMYCEFRRRRRNKERKLITPCERNHLMAPTYLENYSIRVSWRQRRTIGSTSLERYRYTTPMCTTSKPDIPDITKTNIIVLVGTCRMPMKFERHYRLKDLFGRGCRLRT